MPWALSQGEFVQNWRIYLIKEIIPFKNHIKEFNIDLMLGNYSLKLCYKYTMLGGVKWEIYF